MSGRSTASRASNLPEQKHLKMTNLQKSEPDCRISGNPDIIPVHLYTKAVSNTRDRKPNDFAMAIDDFSAIHSLILQEHCVPIDWGFLGSAEYPQSN